SSDLVANTYYLIIKKLCFINTNHIATIGQNRNIGSSRNWCGANFVGIVRHYHIFVVTHIYGWFKNFHFLPSKLCTFQPPYQFFGLSREHGTTDNFYPTKLFFMIYCIFEKHFVILTLKQSVISFCIKVA